MTPTSLIVTNSEIQCDMSFFKVLTISPLCSRGLIVNTVGPAPLMTVAYALCALEICLIVANSGIKCL